MTIAVRSRAHVALLALLALVLFGFAASSCASQGQAPVVGFATVLGDGDARVNVRGEVVVLGQMQGEVGVFMVGSGFPLTYPVHTIKGGWLTRDADGNWKGGRIGIDSMPWWVAAMYRPDELARIAAHLGYSEILIDPQPVVLPEPEPDAPPET